jgi:signal transduction histidine kinase
MMSKDQPGTQQKLQFKHLPAFADFLLKDHLRAVTAKQIDLLFEVDLPVLKRYDRSIYTRDQLIDRSIPTYTEFLRAAAANRLDPFIDQVISTWENNQLPEILRDELVTEDLTLTIHVCKKSLLFFIREYTSDVDAALELVREMDDYSMEANARAFYAYLRIHRNRIDGINRSFSGEEEELLADPEEKLRELNFSLKQKNNALERANKELTSFSYVASHDLQEPIRKIRTFTNLIMETENNLSAEGKNCFNRIIVSAGRMQKLIDDLLSFSRAQVFEDVQKPVDLNTVFSEINSFYKESIAEGKLSIQCGQLPVIQAIPFQIQQLMQNIISNSIKYSKPDKRTEVRIKAELVQARQLPYFSAKQHSRSYHKISIKDNGIGFDQVYSEKIFEMFQRLHGRTEYSGTGIGLSICKKIMENHQGHISATGVPDQGAVFDIYFPSQY